MAWLKATGGFREEAGAGKAGQRGAKYGQVPLGPAPDKLQGAGAPGVVFLVVADQTRSLTRDMVCRQNFPAGPDEGAGAQKALLAGFIGAGDEDEAFLDGFRNAVATCDLFLLLLLHPARVPHPFRVLVQKPRLQSCDPLIQALDLSGMEPGHADQKQASHEQEDRAKGRTGVPARLSATHGQAPQSGGSWGGRTPAWARGRPAGWGPGKRLNRRRRKPGALSRLRGWAYRLVKEKGGGKGEDGRIAKRNTRLAAKGGTIRSGIIFACRSPGMSDGSFPELVFPSIISLAAASASTAPAVADAGAAVPNKPVLPMIIVGLVLAATFASIAFEWLHKSVAALLGAVVAVVVALVFGVYSQDLGYGEVHEFIAHDLSVIGVIVGTSIIVAIAGDSGLFHFLGVKMVKLTGGEASRLLPAVMIATVLFVTFLTITPGVLIMASLVLVITKALDINPRPYIIAVAISANSGAFMTFASGIPTLMIGTSVPIPYLHFFPVATPLALVSAVVAFLVIRLMYRRVLVPSADPEAQKARVGGFDEWALVRDRSLFYRSAAILLATILGFATAQQLGVGLDFIAMAGAAAALIFSGFSPDEAIRKVKWPVILFFVGLFVLIGTVRETGLLDVLAAQIYAISGPNLFLALVLIVPFVFVTAGIVDNIPVAATMIPVIESMIARGLDAEPLWWALIAACNLGGNPTPVGSIAAVIALHALEKERNIRIGWGEYMKIGGSVTLLQVFLVVAWIWMYQVLDLYPSLAPR